jgi:hypothetical protein
VEIGAELFGNLQLPVVELAEAGRADQAKDIGLLRVHGAQQVMHHVGRDLVGLAGLAAAQIPVAVASGRRFERGRIDHCVASF